MKVLTFDIEDWFHIEFDDDVSRWSEYSGRLEKNMEYIFSALERTGYRATFFCLGWIAEKYPHIIRKISDLGFEIGSHTYDHRLLYQRDKKWFYRDCERTTKTIEDRTGKKVRSFRAPAYSITKNNTWVFEVLHAFGIQNDSSIFPAQRDNGGFDGFSASTPVILDYKGMRIKEFPMNTVSFMGVPFVFSGGGYFRLLPYFIVKKLADNADYVMAYFHPRDFDREQPVLKNLPLNRKIKSYVGLKTCFNRFNRFLEDYQFVDIARADKEINWSEDMVVRVN